MDVTQQDTLCLAPLLLEPPPKDTSIVEDGHRAVVAVSNLLWENGLVSTFCFQSVSCLISMLSQNLKYCFMAGQWQGGPESQKLTRQAFSEWGKYCSLTFELVPEQTADIRVSFNHDDGNWSAVGTAAKRQPATNATINLASVAGAGWAEAYELSVALHEIGHALGLYHEHQSPTRGNHVTLDEDGEQCLPSCLRSSSSASLAVLKHFQQYERWTAEQVWTNLLNVYNASDLSNFSEFDPESIML